MAHTLEQEAIAVALRAGISVGFFRGVMPSLFEDMQELQPTIVLSVPRVWKRFSDKVHEMVASKGMLTRMLFSLACNRKINGLRTGVAPYGIWDSLVLGKVAEKVGKRLKLIICGGAPLDPALEEWTRAVLNVPFHQGYGLTETFAMAVVHCTDEQGPANVGSPLVGTTVRLVDVPDMNYFATASPPRGEIWIKGLNVTRGYFRNEKATAEVFSPDGWFMTGDVGQLNPNGTVSIIDRKKNIFKLSQGEYIIVELLENIYSQCPEVSQIWVWGSSFENFLVAVVVPNLPTLEAAGRSLGVANVSDHAALCANRHVRDYIVKALHHLAQQNSLKGYEVIKEVLLDPVPWVPEGDNDVVTPSLKLKRHALQAKYKPQLEQMCAYVKEKGLSGEGSSAPK
jgi:long-chain acyl-CoA synthetase